MSSRVIENDADNELCGCRSSGVVELVAVVILEAQGQLLHGLRGAVKSLDMVVCPLGGRSIVGDELRRRRMGWSSLQSKQWMAVRTRRMEEAEAHNGYDELGGMVGDELLQR